MTRGKASPCVYTFAPATASLRRYFPLTASAPLPNHLRSCDSQITFSKSTEMEGSRRRDSSSPSMLADLTATQGCENESSPSSSDLNSNSSLTFDNSKSRLYQIEDSAKDCVTAWTDEKHDLYLDHLESSFVEQLHRSLGLLSWCSDKDSKTHYSSQKSIAKTQNTYDKFKLMQDDCLDKIDHKRKKNHKFADHRNDVAEFSDQNFVVEASEQKCRKKRSKTILSQV